jgi:ubiquitin-activating enzyme E1 C
MLWPQDKPFGDIPIDGDDPMHIKWLYEKSLDRLVKKSLRFHKLLKKYF